MTSFGSKICVKICDLLPLCTLMMVLVSWKHTPSLHKSSLMLPVCLLLPILISEMCLLTRICHILGCHGPSLIHAHLAILNFPFEPPHPKTTQHYQCEGI